MNRRRFLKNSAGLLVPLSFGIIVPAKAQSSFQLQRQIAAAGATAAAGGNNIALVGSQTFHAGDATNASTIVMSTPGNVTNGNVVIVGVFVYSITGDTITAGMLTKTSGTSTIGTIALDSTVSPAYGENAIFRVPITGSGSLTLTFNPAGTYYMGAAGAEFSGFNASPVGTPGSNTGTGTTLTTGSIVTAEQGMIFAVGSNNPNADFTWGGTDTVLVAIGTGGSTATGLVEYKIINSSPNTLSPTTGADSETWGICWVPYKTS